MSDTTTALSTVKRLSAGMVVLTDGDQLHCSAADATVREVIDSIEVDDRGLTQIVMRSGRETMAWSTDGAHVEVVTEPSTTT